MPLKRNNEERKKKSGKENINITWKRMQVKLIINNRVNGK